MRAEFTAIVRRSEGRFLACCAEVPGTEVEAETEQEALESLAEAVSIVFEVNRNDAIKDAGREASRHPLCITLDHVDESRLLQVEEGVAEGGADDAAEAEVAVSADC